MLSHRVIFVFLAGLCFSGSAVAEDTVAKDLEPIQTTTPTNTAPVFANQTEPNVFGNEPLVATFNKPIRFILKGHDAEGDSLTFSAAKLPDGAELFGKVGEFLWTPTEKDVGEHRIEFEITDGKSSAFKVARITVSPNRAPYSNRQSPSRATITSGGAFVSEFVANDPEGDVLTYYAEDLPEGATFRENDGYMEWKPSDGQTGLYTVRVFATDGELVSPPMVQTIEVIEEWESMFLPGAYFQTYLPHNPALGTYMGVGLEIVPYSWIHLNDNRGPSHGRIYVRGELLTSSKKDSPATFIYGIGTSLSIERNPTRRWLIPYFGFDLGGIAQNGLGHSYQVTPHAGLYFWVSRNVSFGVQGGYLIAPENLDGLRGWKLTAGGNYTLW